MAPKKGQKMSLNAFLEDSSLGSWADEMESLPTAPAPKTDEDRARAGEFGARRDYLSTRPDRSAAPTRDDVPLPTNPPFTAFVGNLAFDLTESELEAFFGPHKMVSVKIIKDRDDRPKGFGYIEFADVEGLKDALTKSGASFSHRTIRVNVAEPPKERERFGGRDGGFGGDDEKFGNNWRRDGPLPDHPNERRGGPRPSRFDGPSENNASDSISDWRSSARGPPKFSQDNMEAPPTPRRKAAGFGFTEGGGGAADNEDTWTIGGKFKPSQPADGPPARGFGSGRGRGDMGPPPPPNEEGDWRRPRVARNNSSPNTSTPPTPSSVRRKLELLPRSGAPSAVPTPLSSPKPAASTPHVRANPFGAAKPVDVTQRELAVEAKIEKERAEIHERIVQHSMSRQGSRQARERGPPSEGGRSSSGAASPKVPFGATTRTNSVAAGGKGSGSVEGKEANGVDETINEVTEKVADLTA